MIRNYFVIAWRNLQRNKTYSFINIAGLAMGMAVAMLVGLWIWDEVSYNSSIENHAQLAQVLVNQSEAENAEVYTDNTVAMPVGDALRTGFGKQISRVSLTSHNGDHILASGDKKLYRAGMWVQQDFPGMFSLKMLQGDRNALKDPSSLLLAQSTAKALFGNEDAINKIIRVDNKQEMKVAGVYEDFSHNTSFHETKLLLPWENKENYLWTKAMTAWQNHCGEAFVELQPGVNVNSVSEKIKNLPTKHIERWKEEIMLHPFDRLNLYTDFKNGKESGGRIDFIRLMAIIGVFVLVLACINFMNLSTARSEKRAKEVGIRKAVGSLRKQLVGQFLGESVVTSSLAAFLAIVIVQISLPAFNGLADKQITIEWTNPWLWLLIVAFTLLTGMLAGSYPAFYLSSFEPVKVLKGVFRSGRLASLPRKMLVVVQFTVSIALIIGTIVVFRQVQYSKSRPVGYERERLISVPLTPDLFGRLELLTDALMKTGAVENVSESSQSTAYFNNNNSIEWRGKDPNQVNFFRDVNVTHDYGKTVRWNIKNGRDFSKEFATDSASAIVNETAAKIMGFQDAVGERVKYHGKEYTIVGVAQDMLTQSPYDEMQPTIFFCDGWMGVVLVKLSSAAPVREALAKIAPVFSVLSPNSPFEYKFIDDEYARKFASEERIGSLAGLFAVLAIFISSLGLFGLSSFVAEQRNKEIGVRKVLGASVFSLWRLMSKEFVVLVLVSLLVAIPIAYYFMHGWLQNYNFRTDLSWWIFALAGSGALVITLLTVSFQSIKTAIANPLKSLRTE